MHAGGWADGDLLYKKFDDLLVWLTVCSESELDAASCSAYLSNRGWTYFIWFAELAAYVVVLR